MRWRETFAEIRLDFLAQNVRTLRSGLNSSAFFCPMVKANAYGHGDYEICRRLESEGVEWVGVSLLEEGIRLRERGVSARILTFAFFDARAAGELIRWKLTPVVGSWEQLRDLAEKVLPGNPFPVHVKFNTGMNRVGFDSTEAKKVADYFRDSRLFTLEGVCTHLLHSEDALDPKGRTQLQIRDFVEIKKEFEAFPVYFHFQNSGALLSGIDAATGARPGLALYGVRPYASSGSDGAKLPSPGDQLCPVMSLKSSLGAVRHVKKDETVSYGGNWRAKKNSVIGVVPIGYADGYMRKLSNRAEVLFRGHRVPVVGTVCMDYTMIDLTEVVHAGVPRAGEEVVLFGQQGSAVILAAELADRAGTIAYEILTGISSRVPRLYV